MLIITIALTSVLGFAAPASAAADSCQAQIPKPLSSTLEGRFPEYRPPLMTDNSAEDVAWARKDGRNPCLGAAAADFDGDGRQDFLLALTARKSSGALVVTALSRGKNWIFHVLDTMPDGRDRLYVEAVEPGKFQRTKSLQGPLGKGEKTSMTCKNRGALFGTVESSGVVYCYSAGKWLHVWISD